MLCGLKRYDRSVHTHQSLKMVFWRGPPLEERVEIETLTYGFGALLGIAA